MDATPQRQKGRDGLLSALDVAIEGLNLAKEISSITPAKAVFGSVSVLLIMIRVSLFSTHPFRLVANRTQDSMANRTDYVELGLTCAGVCKALDRGMNGRRSDQFSRSVFEAIEELTAWVEPVVAWIAFNLLTVPCILEPWLRSRGTSSS